MAERFINNLHIGPDLSERELVIAKLYKSVASLLELQPVFVHFEVGTSIDGNGLVGLIGTNITYDVKDIDRLNMTIGNKYVWEVALVDTSITAYSTLIAPGIARPVQPLFIKLDNLTSEPFDFICTQPIEKQNNRIIYLNQKTFPSQLNIKYGHCVTDSNSSSFGTFYDFNQTLGSSITIAPFAVFYSQNANVIRFRLSIRQIHIN